MPHLESSASPSRIIPELTHYNRPFWTGGSRGQLLIQWCQQCSRWQHPPESTCRGCGGVVVAKPASGHGLVFTYTVNCHPFNPEVPVPYVIAVVQLEEQDDLRLVTNIVDCEHDAIRVGMAVEVRFERQYGCTDATYFPIFAPRKSL
jgi:uncharacterized protein